MKLEELIAEEKSVGICTSKSTLAKLNFTLISALVKNNMKILFFAVEKPHHYMSHLLGINGIKQRNITYVDVLSPEASRVSFPLSINGNRGLRVGGFVSRDILLPDDYDVIIVDDIGFLNHMWSHDTLRNFIKALVREAKNGKTTIIFPFKSTNRIKELLEEELDMIIRDEEVIE